MVWTLILLVLGLIGFLYSYLTWTYDYWQKKGVPFYPPSLIFGSSHDLFQVFGGAGSPRFLQRIYNEYNARDYLGLYMIRRPAIVTGNPEYIKRIWVKDNESFVNNPTFGGDDGVFSRMLFNAKDTRWKVLRSAMSPAFTSSRMRQMAPKVEEIANRLCDKLISEGLTPGGVNVKEITGKFSMDAIAAVAFAFESNSFGINDSKFTEKARIFFRPEGVNKFLNSFMFMMPDVIRMLGISPLKEPIEFFTDVVKQVTERRANDETFHSDFLHQMLQVEKESKNDNNREYKITHEDVVAQAVLFFVAAYDTTASTLTFALWLLALNPEVQEKAREEVVRVLKDYDGKVTHDAVMAMPLIDAILNETLRMFPVATMSMRRCNKDYKLGDTGVTIEKGMDVVMPTFALHRDPVYWPNPMTFDPERFLPPRKDDIVPYTFVPFSVGPRMCLGMRLGQLEMRIALAVALRGAVFSPSRSTPRSYDIEFEITSGLLYTKRPLCVKVTKVE